MRVWSTRHHGSKGLNFIGNPHPTWQFSHTQFSWASPPYTMGKCPHGRNFHLGQQSHGYLHPTLWGCIPMVIFCLRFMGTSTLHCGDASLWSYFCLGFGCLTGHLHPPICLIWHCCCFSFSFLHSYSTLGHSHPPFIFVDSLFLKGTKGTPTLLCKPILTPKLTPGACVHTHTTSDWAHLLSDPSSCMANKQAPNEILASQPYAKSQVPT